MRKEQQIKGHILNLRKAMNLRTTTEAQRDKIWVAMLILQWSLEDSSKKQPVDITPLEICGVFDLKLRRTEK